MENIIINEKPCTGLSSFVIRIRLLVTLWLPFDAAVAKEKWPAILKSQ